MKSIAEIQAIVSQVDTFVSRMVLIAEHPRFNKLSSLDLLRTVALREQLYSILVPLNWVLDNGPPASDEPDSEYISLEKFVELASKHIDHLYEQLT